MVLQEIHREILSEIYTQLGVVASGAPVAEIADSFEQLSAYFQALGVCHLLETADADQFRENLVRSGHARRYFLRQSKAQGNDRAPRLALSRTEAFLDAVAAGTLELAREIAERSVANWEPDWEYEDDFCYYAFLHSLVRFPQSPPQPEASALLQRFEKALEGQASPRLDVCQTLLAGDAEAFAEALNGLMEVLQDALDVKKQTLESYQEPLFWPRTFVSAEGLALLKIAELRNFAVPEEVPLCPSLGRLPPSTREFQDLFQAIEQGRAAEAGG